MQTPIKGVYSEHLRRTASPLNVAREASAAESMSLRKTTPLKHKITDTASKSSPRKIQDSGVENYRNLLISRAEAYTDFINTQKIGHRKRDEQSDDVKRRLNRALEDLEEACSAEQKQLQVGITALNNNFGKNVGRVERDTLKQIEKLKQELIDAIHREKLAYEDRVKKHVDLIAERVAPPNIRDAKGKAMGSSNVRSKSPGKSALYNRPTSPRKERREVSKSAKPVTSLRAYKMSVLNAVLNYFA